MSIQRPINIFEGKSFFESELPIYVNRTIETYDVIEHKHDFLEISYVGEGSGTHYIGDQSVQVQQGDLFVIPVGVSHVFRPLTTSLTHTLIVYNCVLAPEIILPLIHNFPKGDSLKNILQKTDWHHIRDNFGDFRRLFLKLHDEYTSKRAGWETGLLITVIELLLNIYRRGETNKGEIQVTSHEMEAALYMIHTQFDTTITLKKAAALSSLGERQFHRKFKKRTGMTFVGYVQSVRIEEACRLLRTSNRKIADIASTIGYQDISFFNRLFRQKTGLSPREYRSGFTDKPDDAATSRQ